MLWRYDRLLGRRGYRGGFHVEPCAAFWGFHCFLELTVKIVIVLLFDKAVIPLGRPKIRLAVKIAVPLAFKNDAVTEVDPVVRLAVFTPVTSDDDREPCLVVLDPSIHLAVKILIPLPRAGHPVLEENRAIGFFIAVLVDDHLHDAVVLVKNLGLFAAVFVAVQLLDTLSPKSNGQNDKQKRGLTERIFNIHQLPLPGFAL